MDSKEKNFCDSEGASSEEEEDLSYGSGGDGVEKFAEGGGDKAPPDYAAVEKHYKILREEDIKQHQENDISTISSVLCVPRGVGCTLLIRNKWCLIFGYDKWFDDEEKAREAAGILREPKSEEQVCQICHEKIRPEKIVSAAACGHPFCSDCWKTHISTSINDGPGCLTLLCPEPTCKFTSGLELVDSLASADDRDKYYSYLYRSYVEHSWDRKWCPAPGCDLAIEFDYSINFDVTCDCSHNFCWNCTEESHCPVNCKTVAKWLEKNRAEGDNTKWILSYTKPCPQCFRPIEKTEGCNHVICLYPCDFNFCWNCLAAWKWGAGGHTDCKKDEREDVSIDEKRRMHAKRYLERYIYFYERWHSNDELWKRAKDILIKARGEKQAQVQFVIETWECIVECRRILKWTYAYGYYSSLENSTNMTFFECLQGEAEAALERLHRCAEKEMDRYLEFSDSDLKDFRSKLARLIIVTRRYFENLVRIVESDFSEIERFGTEACPSSKKQKH